ncbi:MAG: efflux RND transporter periplasmic adaptor subunit [Gammaproteobacteria bacterium]|nr:efflux RND transporter periplasmic adaptor subunit [Gammaproteobacteria bacterium]
MTIKKQIFIHLMGLTLLFGCDSSDEESTESQQVSPKIVAWFEISPNNEHSQRVLAGLVSAAERTRLSFQSQGQVQTINVGVGEGFKKGQSLATLDTTNYKLQLQQAQAKLNSAIAQRNQAQIEVKRREKLVKSKAVSKSQLDAFRLQLTSAQQSINAATAQVELAEKQLTDTQLIAPFDGTVTAQMAEVGQLVNPQVPVFGVEANQPPEVTFSIPENMISAVTVGHSASVIFSALPNTKVSGAITEISSQAQIGAFSAKLVLNNPPSQIKAGMSAEILLSTAVTTNTNGLTISPSALGAGANNEHFVYRIKKAQSDNKLVLEKVGVNVIDFSEHDVNIESAKLHKGDKIVRSGLNFLAPQQRVTLMGEGEKTINP